MTQQTAAPPLFLKDVPAEQTLQAYFETLNAQDFEETVELFVAEGRLHPPFEDEIVGSDKISAYLQREAQGLTLVPKCLAIQPRADSGTHYLVSGDVVTALFKVRVSWKFHLNSAAKIIAVQVNLLADLRDLLTLKKLRTN